MAGDNHLPLCAVSSVPPDTMRGVRKDDADYLVVNDGGTFRVFANRCPHRGARLSAGKLEGGVLACPWHGSRFDIHTGKLLSGPRVGPAWPWFRSLVARFVRDLPEYPCVVAGDTVGVARGAS